MTGVNAGLSVAVGGFLTPVAAGGKSEGVVDYCGRCRDGLAQE
jgi:hypothetical protein